MPRLILHTGFHKTGSTSVQNTLHNNKKALAKQGFLYPITGLTDNKASWGHHDLAYALRSEATGRALWQDLRAEADQAKLPNVIISSEELSVLPYGSFPALKPYHLIRDVFAGYDIILICYLRPQADMLASMYNHHVKSVGETRDIITFLAKAAPRLDYMHYLHVAGSALGDAAIRVRRYGADWLRGDIIEDLATEVGIDLSLGIQRPKRDLNPGLTKDGLAAMIEANTRLAHDPVLLKRERLRLLDQHRAPPFMSGDMLSPDARRTITAVYQFKNIQIGQRFLKLKGDLFDPNIKPIVKTDPG